MTTTTQIDFRAEIVRKADKQVKRYLFDEAEGERSSRELKEVIESLVATDYDGRTVIELLQNGHDAHPRDRHDGELEVLLDETEADYGVLYVANRGCPVELADFESLCSIGLSSKRPDQGIGNKGAGFKSVLQLTESPEIYSASVKGAGRFDGFCLRFALPADFDDVAQRVVPDRVDLADALRENVAGLKVPIPLYSIPESVNHWADRGFSTVVRLMIRSERARDRARTQLKELEKSDVPLHLFLERVAAVTFIRRTVEGDHRTSLTCHRQPEIATGSVRCRRLQIGVCVQKPGAVDARDESEYILLARTVPEAVMQRAIRDSRFEHDLSAGWENWKGDAQVCVALPTESALASGRLYTFLPMGEAALAPLAGYVNAPFFARLNRQSLVDDVRLNERLMSEIAALCASALVESEAGGLDLGAEQLIDLMAWSAPALPRLTEALAQLGAKVEELLVVPTIGTPTKRVALRDATLWLSEGQSFNAHSVARCGIAGLFDSTIDRRRLERLRELAKALGVGFEAEDERIVGFAEVYAAALAVAEFDSEAWAAFFDDVAVTVRNGELLFGRKILVDDQGRLLAPGDGSEGPVVFVARRETDEQDAVPSPPPGVAERLAFTHPEIPRRVKAGGALRPGWGWLERFRLVREYETAPVLQMVGQLMRASTTAEDSLMGCLRFAFEVWRGIARDVAPERLKQAGLRVPAARGWITPESAVFGQGWGGETQRVDSRLAQLLAIAGSEVPSLQSVGDSVLRPPEAILGSIDGLDELRAFLEAIGVFHGLPPRFVSARFELRGELVGHPTRVGYLWQLREIPTDRQAEWLRLAAGWPRTPPSYTTTPYTPASAIAVLPGQSDWDHLDKDARRIYAELVLHGLDTWPEDVLEFTFRYGNDAARPVWPSFVSAFLANADWIPQTTPGERSNVEFMAPKHAWWLQESEVPDYLRGQPPALRTRVPKVLERLQKLGVRFWDDPASAAERLEELVETADSPFALAVRKAYEAAWADLLRTEGAIPARVLADRHGRLCAIDLGEEGEHVYVGVPEGVAKARLLRQAPVLMLPINDLALAAKVHRRLTLDGTRRLRTTAEAEVLVTADGLPGADLAARPLAELGGRWLPVLVLGLLEYDDNPVVRLSEKSLRAAEQALRKATISIASDVVTAVDGHRVSDTTGAASIVLDSERILVAATDRSRWHVLQSASGAIAELAGRPAVAPRLRLALIDLERANAGEPGEDEIARILGVHVDTVRGLADRGADLSDVIAVLACIDPALAEELKAVVGELEGREGLEDWLETHLADTPNDAQAVIALAGLSDLLRVLETLGVELEDANASWRALGLPLLTNARGHERAMAEYLQRERSLLQDRLRDRFLPMAADADARANYVRLREFPGLAADERWLEKYWEVPHEAIASTVEEWLDRVAPPSRDLVERLPSVDELRDTGRRTITSVIANARALVDAWLHRHAAGVGNRPGEHSDVIEAMTSEGLLDFARLTARDVVDWLVAHDQWPIGMSAVTSLAELGLSPEEVTSARARLAAGREEDRRKATYIEYGGKTYSADIGDLSELADALREELRVDPTPGSTQKLALADIAIAAAVPPNKSAPAKGSRARTPPPDRTTAIGFVGEIVVGEWILEHFGVAPEDSWQSGYRLKLYGDGIGSDTYGYDFAIVSDGRTQFFEVKSTVDDECVFTLAPSEVVCAQSLEPDQDYDILFVPHVLDQERRRVFRLPNPFEHGGLQRYRLLGRAMRLGFELGAAAD